MSLPGIFLPKRRTSVARLPGHLTVLAFASGLIPFAGLCQKTNPAPDATPAAEARLVTRASFVDEAGRRYVWIEPGTFAMGSGVAERAALADADSGMTVRDLANEPAHPVTLARGYWLADREVTIGDYAAFLNAVGRSEERWLDTAAGDTGPIERGEDGVFRMRRGRGPVWGDETLPIVLVSWHGAQAYCDWLQKTMGARLPEGYRYQLPTEAEWEHACRAGTATMTPSGDLTIVARNHAPELDAIAWYGGNSGLDHPYGWDSRGWEGKQDPHEVSGLHPVARKQPNPLGLHDLLGNAWEWCGDWYEDRPEGVAVTDPTGPAKGYHRVTRGGSWYDPAVLCRAARRDGRHPEVREFFQGFRVAISSLTYPRE